jgi:hypothetical protein
MAIQNSLQFSRHARFHNRIATLLRLGCCDDRLNPPWVARSSLSGDDSE